jgi:DNA-binding beta-propeller fold protein YncE
MHASRLASSLLIGLIAAGCSSQGGPRAAIVPTLSLQHEAHAKPYLYVGNTSSVSVYGFGEARPFRTIQRTPCGSGLAFDPTGNLYVLCGAIDVGYTAEYATGTSNKLRELPGEGILSIAVDDLGYVYLAGGQLLVYPPQGGKLWHRIVRDARQPAALLFDQAGDLYVAHLRGVGIFGPESPGKPKLLRGIKVGVRGPRALGIDDSGALFVANCLTCIYNDRRDSVTVYAKNGSQPIRTIVKAVRTPFALAVDSKGRLYVANVPVVHDTLRRGFVSVYAPGSTTPLRKITAGVNRPFAIAVDPDDNLYVANSYGNSVTVYSPGGGKLLRKITRGVTYPTSLAFSNY